MSQAYKAAGWSLPSICLLLLKPILEREGRGGRGGAPGGGISLCTHIIDSQRWQTNYSFRLNASLLCILFANSPLFPSCVLEKHKTKWVHRLCFWLSPALCLSPLFFFFLTKKNRFITWKKAFAQFQCICLFWLLFKINYFNWRLITILWWFFPYIDMHQPQVFMCPPSRNPLPPPSPSHPSGLSQCTSFECPVSCIRLALVIYFT